MWEVVARMESILAPKKVANCSAVCNVLELAGGCSSHSTFFHGIFESTHLSTAACTWSRPPGRCIVDLRTQLAMSRTTLNVRAAEDVRCFDIDRRVAALARRQLWSYQERHERSNEWRVMFNESTQCHIITREETSELQSDVGLQPISEVSTARVSRSNASSSNSRQRRQHVCHEYF